jgi:hypothetical protein
MKQLIQWIVLGLVAASTVACSNISMPSMGGIFGGSGAVSVADHKNVNSTGPLLKYAASIHINAYTDDRKMDNPRKIGTGAENVSGMSGKDIVLDQDATAMVAGAMMTSLDEAGFQVSEMQTGKAQFELSGIVKELTYNVKARDEVSIAIETTLTEISTNKVVWSAIVTEKADRFAGVSGDNKDDVTHYLRKELGIVTQKTTDAISASLMVVHPELFNLTPGTKAIPGVTVLVAPTVNPPAAAAPVPMQMMPPPSATNAAPSYPVYTPHASDTNGLLLVNTNPARAKIYLDNVYFGLSPLRLELDPGVHTISVKLIGYKMVTEKVSVRKGDSTEMDLDLEH